jgi:3-hydroxyisobutyrate dehydrogenase-like beta-hydroxyacid dehydrogenase
MTSIATVGILSPGEMGAAVGQVLHRHGLRVVTCLEGRGDWTVSRAKEAGIEGLQSYDELVREADILLSILVPAQARAVAGIVAQALRRTGAALAYVDCNAVSPQTVREVARTVTEAGARFVDAAIIGGPPMAENGPRFYASGPDTEPFEELRAHGLDVHLMGGDVGQASGFKMIYGATTKGIAALWMELMVAAEAMGLRDALEAELAQGDNLSRQRVERFMSGMAARSGRYVGEMEEIAATFEGVGLTPRMLLGAADMFALVAKTPLADHPGGHRHGLHHVLEVLAGAAVVSSDSPLPH